MAEAKQDKKQEKSNPSSEGFGFKQSPLGFDKNEVNLYINKLKKQMKEQQQEYESRIDNMRKNLEDQNDEMNALKTAARDGGKQAAASAPAAPKGHTDSDIISAVKEAVDKIKEETGAKIMELRKQVLDERRNVAKLDKDCAMAQMSEKKVREEYAKLKEKYIAAKKAGGGGKAVVSSNADEVIDEIIAEAEKLAKEIISSADAYAKASVESVNAYKAKVEAELKARGEKLDAAKKTLEEQSAKTKAENEAAKKNMADIAAKISAVTASLGGFASGFESVNSQITAVTGQIDSVTGQFGSLSAQINEATASIDKVTKQFGTVSEQINNVTATIGGVTQQFTDVSGKLNAAKDSFGSVSETLEKAKSSFGDVTKTVNETKSGIDGIKSGAEEAAGLVSPDKAHVGDTSALGSVSEAITAASANISAELILPELKSVSFDKAKLSDLKKKLKIETTYEGGEEVDIEDDDADILSSIEIDEIPETPAPTDDELMADIPEPEPVSKPEPVKEAKAAKPRDDELSDFFITPTTDKPGGLINTTGVGAIDDFSLNAEPEPIDDDFNIVANDLSASPDKGMDLGEDIFDMAMSPIDANDDTLNSMIATQKKKEEEGDFMLTPAEISDEYKPGTPASKINDDFGEFADLFAAGSAETNSAAEKKKPAKFRQPQSDDPFSSLLVDSNSSDDDMSSSGSDDFSDFLL